MKRKRSMWAGMTDYTGFTLPEILKHLAEWRDATRDDVARLQGYARQAEEKRAMLKRPDYLLIYIGFFIDLFQRYLEDFERLLRELPDSVLPRHIEIVSQIFKSSVLEEDRCVRFKQDYLEECVEEEAFRPLLEDIYECSRGLIIDYKDLSNLDARLRTFVGVTDDRPETEALRGLELKPNIWGIGLNLNYLIQKVWDWWRKR